jgi:hypothetical protein
MSNVENPAIKADKQAEYQTFPQVPPSPPPT